MTEDEGDDAAAKATKKKKDGPRVHIRMTEERLKRWREAAAREAAIVFEDADVSGFVRKAVEDYIARYPERHPPKKKRRRPKKKRR